MYRKDAGESGRLRRIAAYGNQSIVDILKNVEEKNGDPGLAQSIYFGPTALTHIRRLIEMGGTIIADTTLMANDIDVELLGTHNARLACYIDDPQIVQLAEQRHVTRAEIAVDYALALEGPKLLAIGSAPAAINRVLVRRRLEPLSDVCVLAAPTGFASVVQLKERLIESDMTTIVVRGKKGGIQVAASLVNEILREIARDAN